MQLCFYNIISLSMTKRNEEGEGLLISTQEEEMGKFVFSST